LTDVLLLARRESTKRPPLFLVEHLRFEAVFGFQGLIAAWLEVRVSGLPTELWSIVAWI